MKKTKALWFLSIFFTWAALKSAGGIYWTGSVTDYALLSSIGIGWLFFVINVPIMLMEASTAFFLFTRKSIAYLVGIAVAAATCISGAIITGISMLNLEAVKTMYIASREARGMTVNQESFGFMFTQQGLLIMFLLYVAFYALVIYYLHRVKPELVGAGA